MTLKWPQGNSGKPFHDSERESSNHGRTDMVQRETTDTQGLCWVIVLMDATSINKADADN